MSDAEPAMKVIYTQFIANDQFLDFWGMLGVSSMYGQTYYGLQRGEARGYADGREVPVPDGMRRRLRLLGLWRRVWRDKRLPVIARCPEPGE